MKLMPPLNSGTDEETYEALHEEIVGLNVVNGEQIETEAEAVEYCVKSILRTRFDRDV